MRVLCVVLVLAVAGCGVSRRGPEPVASSSLPPVTSSASASPEEFAVYLAWVDGVCQVYARRTTGMPAVPLTWDGPAGEAERPAIVQYVTGVRDMFVQSRAALANLPTAPTLRTQELADAEIAGIDEALEDGYATIVEEVAAAPEADLRDWVDWVSYSVHSWEPKDPTLRGLLAEDSVLARAYNEAPSC